MVCTSSLILVVDACQFSALGDNSTTRYALNIFSSEHTYTCARTCKHTIQLGVNAPLEHYDYFSNYCFSRDHTNRLDRELFGACVSKLQPLLLSYYCNKLSADAQNVA